MGVKGLWRLLLPIGRRISIETLEGKILAVDASIWLTQFLKAMRDPATGKLQTAAHLVGFFRRLCRLQYHGIKAVFVFDGASPEIKLHELALRRRRREQFAATSDETVQRLARRLLAEQLQKQAQKKKSMPSKGNNGGAYAAGFNPGGQAEEEEETQQDGERRSQQNGEGRGEGHGLSASGAPKDQASGEEVVILDDEDDEGEVNDWDMKPAAAQPEEHIDESEDDSDTEWKVVNDAAVENEDDEFLVNHIASLPANKRKEAIEDAKRRQRLRSRREFMPAAANPNDFSQVQLQNFLRSSRLNQSIVKMASAAAARDNHGLPGEAMASDPTTRLELIREDEEEEEKNDDINIFKTYSPKKRRPCRLTKKKDPDSSSDDESWGEGVGEDKNPSGNGSSRAQRRVIDDDSDGGSDSSDVQVIEARGPPQGKTNGPSSFDKMPSGGGEFLAKSSDVMSPTKPKGKVVIDVDDEGEKEAGGFLKHSDDQTETNVAQDYAGEGGFVRAPEPEESIPEERISTNDAAYAQELEDRALAKALQEEEDTFTTQEDVSETFLFRTADKFKGTVSEQEMEEHLLAEALQMSQKDFGSKEGMATLPNQKKGAQKPSRTAMVPSNQFAVADDDEETSEDEVDWEDGDMSSAGKIVEKSSSDNSDISPDDASLQRKESSADLENDFIKGCESPKSLPSETGRDQNSWELLTETAAALERAQTTASSLANWAGRAFRRAVLEANVPESLKNHSPHRDRNNVTSETAVEAEDSGEHLASTASLQNPATVTNANDANESVATATCVDSSKPTAEQFISSITEEEDARWTAERNRRERDTDTVTDEMLLEAKQLLQLFGVPYVEAPAEAESQCAELERLGLVDGIVTEDSDVFVFGGKTGKCELKPSTLLFLFLCANMDCSLQEYF
jgi:DNA excision repair protein ERCC-5